MFYSMLQLIITWLSKKQADLDGEIFVEVLTCWKGQLVVIQSIKHGPGSSAMCYVDITARE
jgi:hypothetical protein